MIGLAFLAFIIFDGAVRHNLAPEAAPVRGAMMAIAALAWLVWMRRGGVRLRLPGALLAGVLAAFAITESYHRCCGQGIAPWLLAGGAYIAQVRARRDWTRDMGLAGVGLAVLVLMVALTAALSGELPPRGMWNRNMVAGYLVMLSPAVWMWALNHRTDRPLPMVDTRSIAPALVALAVITSGSRGALIAWVVSCFVMAWTFVRTRVTRRGGIVMACSSVGVLFSGLIWIRPGTVWRRVECAQQVLAHWWANSRWFGLGNFRLELAWGDYAINAHAVGLTLVAVTGLVGVAVIALYVLGLVGRRPRITVCWQAASLAGWLVHALIEENISWWPAAIVVGIAAADVFREEFDATHVL